MCTGRNHPHKAMRGIFDFRPHGETLELMWKYIEHCLSRDESCRPKRHTEFVASSIIVAARLERALWDTNPIQYSYFWWSKFVKSRVLVPAIEAGDTFRFIFVRDT